MAEAWSDRFDEGLHPFIQQFNASIGFDINLLQEDLDGSIAHAEMLSKCGVITADEASQLVNGLEKIRLEAAEGSFQPSLVDEDIHFAIERRLIALLGAVGKKLHTGRSRNDQVGCDLRLWLRRRIDDLDQQLEHLQNVLLAQSEIHLYTLIPGYTHLQRAQPLSLAHHLIAYIEMFQRDRERLKDVRSRVNISPLGAAALAGTSVAIDRRFTASALGFSDIYSWIEEGSEGKPMSHTFEYLNDHSSIQSTNTTTSNTNRLPQLPGTMQKTRAESKGDILNKKLEEFMNSRNNDPACNTSQRSSF